MADVVVLCRTEADPEKWCSSGDIEGGILDHIVVTADVDGVSIGCDVEVSICVTTWYDIWDTYAWWRDVQLWDVVVIPIRHIVPTRTWTTCSDGEILDDVVRSRIHVYAVAIRSGSGDIGVLDPAFIECHKVDADTGWALRVDVCVVDGDILGRGHIYRILRGSRCGSVEDIAVLQRHIIHRIHYDSVCISTSRCAIRDVISRTV